MRISDPLFSDPLAGVPARVTGVLTIDLQAIVRNWRLLADRVGPAVLTTAVVKADAYGLGVTTVAPALAAAGCRRFFVATIDEGIELRQAFDRLGSTAEVAVLGGVIPGTAADIAAHGLLPVLNDLGQVSHWSEVNPGRPAILQLDTGMSRLGLPAVEMARLAADPDLLARVPLIAVMSHLACADDPTHPLNRRQAEELRERARRLPPAPLSLAASSGIFLGPAFHHDMVRPGCALYGINPTPSSLNPMSQVIGLKAKIVQVQEIDAGRHVGYGATFSAGRTCRVATVGVGYADGFLRAASGRGRAFVGDREVPIIGRVSMDLITIDVTALPPADARPGGWIELLSRHYTADDLAQDAGTIGYEVLTRLGRRLHRVYAPADLPIPSRPAST
ncbi:MAG TPA: alanine racemase [Stellaceae bacterium]|nr:alanine racemase [Stellaceae bacterium]